MSLGNHKHDCSPTHPDIALQFSTQDAFAGEGSLIKLPADFRLFASLLKSIAQVI